MLTPLQPPLPGGGLGLAILHVIFLPSKLALEERERERKAIVTLNEHKMSKGILGLLLGF
jgi:hypothetical protein